MAKDTEDSPSGRPRPKSLKRSTSERKRTKRNRHPTREREKANGIQTVDKEGQVREDNAEAGPGPSTLKSRKKERASPREDTQNGFAGGDDFIPFGFDDSDEGDEDIGRKGKESPRKERKEREWDKGKGKSRDWERDRERDRDRGSARKRKADDYDADDGFANKKQRLDAASRKAPWTVDVDWDTCANVAEMLHREVEAFTRFISPSSEEDEVRSLVVQMIQQAVMKNFADAKVMPFGSFETKLYLPLGDIDLVVVSKSMAYSDRVTVLHALANTLKRAHITDKVTIIAKAKVPIIKFITIHGRLAVDISINQENGLEAGRVVNNFLAEMPALRSLVMICKAFLSQRSMNEVFSGGLGSYSIVCLCISFLQMHPKIRKAEIDPMKNLGVLVMEFFELYGCYFNYEEAGISLRDGGTYFSKRARGWSDYQKSTLLSIEDPIDMSNDIARGSYNLSRVRQTFAGAHGIMTAAAYTLSNVLHSRRTGRSVNLRGHTEPEDMSILSHVLGITQESINRRRLIQEIYDKRVLHRLLGVSPKATVVHDRSSANGSSTSRKNGASASGVQSVWEKADGLREGRSLFGLQSPSPPSRKHDIIDVDALDSEEESRYAMPPKKRQRVGNSRDTHTVFTTDEEDTDDDKPDIYIHTIGDDDDDSLAEEEEEYARADSGSESGEVEAADGLKRREVKTNGASVTDKKRAYWASKGIAPASPDFSS
ncbi:hypothetical protein EWM64_g3977 [Hericium alpestre]|uniref:polynucleotide adenylyltransferase n=1 Tax=Hericium alpestre TaxID=135208 RepID=A0A4Z0A1G4_9AGAM|nr:hypothetical protein EWM64_g3977 [Hericium alpestre]